MAIKTYSYAKLHPHIEVMKVEENVRESWKFELGWERRPRRGMTIGLNTVYLYQDEFDAFFAHGNEDKGKKVSAAQMCAALEIRFADRFDFPDGARYSKSY